MFLTGLVSGSVVGLAGCNESSPAPDSGTESPGPDSDETAVPTSSTAGPATTDSGDIDGGELLERVEIVDNRKIVARVNARSPELEEVDEFVHVDGRKKPFAPDRSTRGAEEEQESFVLEWSLVDENGQYTYWGGTQKVVARNEFEEVVQETSLELDYDVHITQFDVLKNADPEPPEHLVANRKGAFDQSALVAVTFENRGAGPVTLRALGIDGFPDDTLFPESWSGDEIEIWDSSYDWVHLEGGESHTSIQGYITGITGAGYGNTFPGCGATEQGELLLRVGSNEEVRYPLQADFAGEKIEKESDDFTYKSCDSISFALGERL